MPVGCSSFIIPVQSAFDVQLVDACLTGYFAEQLLQVVEVAGDPWTVRISEKEMLQAAVANLSEVSFGVLGLEILVRHVGEDKGRDLENSVETH